MSDRREPLESDEVAVLPVDQEAGIALVIGASVTDEISWKMPQGLVSDFLAVGGLIGAGTAAKSLLDGSLVRLAPQTMEQLRQGAVFVTDAQGFSLGTLSQGGNFAHAVRFLPGAANPLAAGMLLQSMVIQLQLRRIEKSLEALDAKLDTLIKGQEHEVLAEVKVAAERVQKMHSKVWDGHPLTQADEIKLRDYEDTLSKHLHQARMWLEDLGGLLQMDDPSLSTQFEVLDSALRREHAAYWLKVFVLTEVVLAETRKLLLFRAASAEPAYAKSLAEKIEGQIAETTEALTGLCLDIDAYLRQHDIADGFEELSLLRKAKVRKLRRQLLEVDEELKTFLEGADALYEVARMDRPDLPEPLDRRTIEPRWLRDRAYDVTVEAAERGKEATRKVTEAGSEFVKSSLANRLAPRDEEIWVADTEGDPES